MNRLADFIRAHRDELALNHRQLAEAIVGAGGTATTQACQQWEGIAGKFKRPSFANQAALARVFGCNKEELESLYWESRGGAPVAARGGPGKTTGATAPQALSLVGLSPIQAALVQKAVELMRAKKIMDKECVDILSAWSEKF